MNNITSNGPFNVLGHNKLVHADASPEKLAKALNDYAVPDPKLVGKLPKGGQQLDFVGHAEVTRILIEIDPLWTWEPCAWDEFGLPAYGVKNNMAHMAGRLTLCGVTRFGVGSALETKPDLYKELVSDFLRNAAMRFGVALNLWSKQEWSDLDHHSPAQQAPAPKAKTDDPSAKVSKTKIIEFAKACGKAGLDHEKVAAAAGVELQQATNADLDLLRAKFKEMKAEADSQDEQWVKAALKGATEVPDGQ